MPVGDRQLDRSAGARTADVVHQDIDAAEPAEHVSYQLLDLIGISDVRVEGGDVTVLGLDHADRRLEQRPLDVGSCDPRALAGEQDGG